MDFPQPERNDSYSARVTIGEVHGLIKKAFEVGADYRWFEDLSFNAW